MRYLFLTLIFISGCANNQSKFEGESLLDANTFYCPRDMIKYCEGRNKKDMDCGCVTKQSLNQAFDFLR